MGVKFGLWSCWAYSGQPLPRCPHTSAVLRRTWIAWPSGMFAIRACGADKTAQLPPQPIMRCSKTACVKLPASPRHVNQGLHLPKSVPWDLWEHLSPPACWVFTCRFLFFAYCVLRFKCNCFTPRSRPVRCEQGGSCKRVNMRPSVICSMQRSASGQTRP